MDKLKLQTQKVKEKALSLKLRVNEAYRERGIRIDDNGIARLLEMVAEDMNKEENNKKRLESHAFGIFRIVTDGWIFEETDLGRELMEFRLELRKLSENMQT